MSYYIATVLTSAFLLFQIQPVIAKQILPWFGGSAAVWAGCMFFFQFTLLLGYLYSHWIVKRLRPSRQPWLHVSLLALSLLWLPAIPNGAWKPTGAEEPTIRLLLLLAGTVGLPFFLLSTTGPLIQAWYSQRFQHVLPYRLYAVSNLASLLALLAYPLLVEPAIATSAQAWIWSGAYVTFAVLCGFTAVMTGRKAPPAWREAVEEQVEHNTAGVSRRPHWREYALWVALATFPSMLLLAVTNYLTKDVASIPFLWILPLSLYLLSFILCFDRDGWYKRGVFGWLLAVAMVVMGLFVWKPELGIEFWLACAVFLSGLFVICMFCHGELASRKPHPRFLTDFFLMISIGGALGGLLVSIVAPLAFSGYFELPLGLAAMAGFALLVLYRKSWQTDIAWLGVCTFVVAPIYPYIHSFHESTLAMDRDFYGSVRVTDMESAGIPSRKMIHDGIVHGTQLRTEELKRTPTAYYGRSSGIGVTLSAFADRPVRIGVVGLGAGTLAAYGKPGDYYRFYEINPLVTEYARKYFSFLSDSPAEIDVVHGDARLSLEGEPLQNFDVLVVDAFSGDSVPTHLLSSEAVSLYFRHLKPGGVLALHVSNLNLDLVPVVQKVAEAQKCLGILFDCGGDESTHSGLSRWAILTHERDFLKQGEIGAVGKPLYSRPGLRLWTDDYSNLFQVLSR
jgi:SAM-dependent methyltransferase